MGRWRIGIVEEKKFRFKKGGTVTVSRGLAGRAPWGKIRKGPHVSFKEKKVFRRGKESFYLLCSPVVAPLVASREKQKKTEERKI